MSSARVPPPNPPSRASANSRPSHFVPAGRPRNHRRREPAHRSAAPTCRRPAKSGNILPPPHRNSRTQTAAHGPRERGRRPPPSQGHGSPRRDGECRCPSAVRWFRRCRAGRPSCLDGDRSQDHGRARRGRRPLVIQREGRRGLRGEGSDVSALGQQQARLRIPEDGGAVLQGIGRVHGYVGRPRLEASQ